MRRLLKASVVLIASAFLAANTAMAQTANAGSSSNSSSGSIAGSNSSVYIQGNKAVRSTGAAFAPSLAIGGFSCQGSVSAGAGGAGWGVAFGTTVMDRDCNTRENAKVAAAAFGVGVGRLVLCNIDQIRAVAPACGGQQVANRPAPKRTLFGYQAPPTPVKALFAGRDATPAKPVGLSASQIGAKQAAARMKAKIAARELASN